MAQISVSNLTFCYEGSFDNIFEDVSFVIDTDWKLGFIGRNGKGKTTFLNILSGKYHYQGNISTSTVFDYFPYQITQQQKEQCASEFLAELKLGCEEWRVICELDKLQTSAEILYRPFETLSFGEQTKVMLAVLFAGDNDFLLIDEPTNHLDIKYQLQIMDIVKSLDLTVVAAVHDLNIAAMYCDRLVAIKSGQVVGMGTPRELLTEEFIYDMYEVRCRVDEDASGRINIVYLPQHWM